MTTTATTLRRGVLLKGRLAIADYLGMTVREVDHQAETNDLPVFHLGRSVAAKVESLDRWVDRQESKPRRPKKEPEVVRVPLRRARYRRVRT
jgi:hypothetical protein